MRLHHFIALCSIVLFGFAFGCGGSAAAPGEGPEATPPPEATAGDEHVPVAEPPVAAQPAAAEEPEETGPASFSTKVTVGGKAAPAHVRVLSSSEQVVVEGEAGASLSLPAGQYYRIEIKISDPKTLFDQPAQTQELTLHPGNNPVVSVDFPLAKVKLNVVVNGKSEANATVKLMRRGEAVGELKSGGDFVPLSPGRYDAEVHVKGSVIEVKDLLFPEGATQTVPVAVQL